MKIGLVLALARYYHGATAQEARLHWKLIIPAGMIGLPFLLVAHQPDLGSAMLLGLKALANVAARLEKAGTAGDVRALGALRETLDEDVRDTQAALHTFPPTETEELTTR